MKSKKAEEYIDNVSVHYTETCYKNDLYFISDKEAAKAVELAEEEMREKAIEAHKESCVYRSPVEIHMDGVVCLECRLQLPYRQCTDKCLFIKEFIDELDK